MTSAASARVTLRWEAMAAPVDVGDDGRGGLHGLLHVQRDVADHVRLDGELPVGEMLDQHAP